MDLIVYRILTELAPTLTLSKYDGIDLCYHDAVHLDLSMASDLDPN